MRLSTFDRTAKGLLSDEDERGLEQEIAKNPDGPPMVRGSGGVRKIRIPLKGHGKSGGARVLYFYASTSATVYILWVFPKNVKDNLTDAEIRAIRALVKQLNLKE